MSGELVAQIEVVVFSRKAEVQYAGLQVGVLSCRSLLALVGLELFHWDAKRGAGLAAVTVRAVGEHAAAPEALFNEAGVGRRVNDMAGSGYLGAGLSVREVTAVVRRSGIKLQCLYGEIRQIGHGRVSQADYK